MSFIENGIRYGVYEGLQEMELFLKRLLDLFLGFSHHLLSECQAIVAPTPVAFRGLSPVELPMLHRQEDALSKLAAT